MYVYSNEIRTKDGVTICAFRNHGVAFTAFMRLNNPEHKPIFGNWLPEDEIKEKEFRRVLVTVV